MTFQEALEITVKGTSDNDLRYIAIQVIARAVCNDSEYGDPDLGLTDWIASGQYKPDDTIESIAEEWDSDRDQVERNL